MYFRHNTDTTTQGKSLYTTTNICITRLSDELNTKSKFILSNNAILTDSVTKINTHFLFIQRSHAIQEVNLGDVNIFQCNINMIAITSIAISNHFLWRGFRSTLIIFSFMFDTILRYIFLPVIKLNFAGNFGGIFVITLEERLQETKVVFRII